jgi:hypothetical protein
MTNVCKMVGEIFWGPNRLELHDCGENIKLADGQLGGKAMKIALSPICAVTRYVEPPLEVPVG